MEFRQYHLYHIYNRGNNNQDIFFSDANYLFFLQKIKKHIVPVCDILNYCLMPNHFNLLIHANEKTIQTRKIGRQERNILSEGMRNLLSSYAQAINEQNNTTGTLFQQNTKSRCVSEGEGKFGLVCFHHIHQHPWKAGIVKKIEEWRHSSFCDYAGFRNEPVCNKVLGLKLLGLNAADLYKDTYKTLDNDALDYIF